MPTSEALVLYATSREEELRRRRKVEECCFSPTPFFISSKKLVPFSPSPPFALIASPGSLVTNKKGSGTFRKRMSCNPSIREVSAPFCLFCFFAFLSFCLLFFVFSIEQLRRGVMLHVVEQVEPKHLALEPELFWRVLHLLQVLHIKLQQERPMRCHQALPWYRNGC